MVPHARRFNNAQVTRQRDRAGAWGLVPLPVATEIDSDLRGTRKGYLGFTGAPGGKSRWTGKTQKMVPLDPVLVAELSADHISGGQFRHGSVVRWRTDKAPKDCTMEQIKSPPNN